MVTSHISLVCSKPRGTPEQLLQAISFLPTHKVQAVTLGLAAQISHVVSLSSKP